MVAEVGYEILLADIVDIGRTPLVIEAGDRRDLCAKFIVGRVTNRDGDSFVGLVASLPTFVLVNSPPEVLDSAKSLPFVVDPRAVLGDAIVAITRLVGSEPVDGATRIWVRNEANGAPPTLTLATARSLCGLPRHGAETSRTISVNRKVRFVDIKVEPDLSDLDYPIFAVVLSIGRYRTRTRVRNYR